MGQLGLTQKPGKPFLPDPARILPSGAEWIVDCGSSISQIPPLESIFLEVF